MPFDSDPLAFYGRNIIQDYHTSLKAKLALEVGQSNSFDVSDDQVRFLPDKKVGILGAGIGGLYAALILDSLDIEYDILEASSRAGGRIFTYQFPGGGKYDYYVCCFCLITPWALIFLLYLGCGRHALPISDEG